jgi:hypothetical protein
LPKFLQFGGVRSFPSLASSTANELLAVFWLMLVPVARPLKWSSLPVRPAQSHR